MPGARSGKSGRGPERPADRGSGPDMDDPRRSTRPSRLDEIRDRPDWDDRRRDVALDRPGRAVPRRGRSAARSAPGSAGWTAATARSIAPPARSVCSTPTSSTPLALALRDQPGLAPDRAWEALGAPRSRGAARRATPNLVERWDELNDAIDPDDALESLVAQLEEEPEGSWVASKGSGRSSPRPAPRSSPAWRMSRPGPAWWRSSGSWPSPTTDSTRRAALDALLDPRRDDPTPPAGLGRDGRRPLRPRGPRPGPRRWRSGPEAAAVVALALEAPGRPSPEPLVAAWSPPSTARAGGRSSWRSRDRGEWIVASFACDVWRGDRRGPGAGRRRPGPVVATLLRRVRHPSRPARRRGCSDLALGLLAGSLLVSGPATNPALRFWIERTVGPGFRARAFAGPDLDDRFEGAAALAARRVGGDPRSAARLGGSLRR